MSLLSWGWSDFWARHQPADAELCPARILAVHRDQYAAITETGERTTECSGALLYTADSPADLPTVGDWVLLRHGIVERVLPRRTYLCRRAAGQPTQPQALAANVDVLMLVSGLDLDLSPRRLERYLLMTLESGARPVFVLNKADLCAALPDAQARVRAVAGNYPVLAVSAATGEGIDDLLAHLRQGETAALLGSSGVGKSTLLNFLLKMAQQATAAVRAHDNRGRHTTTQRQLFRLPNGALVIDQPGLREIQLWADPEAASQAFPDVSLKAANCRYRDCQHRGEPGCAVQAAVVAGELAVERLASWHKLRRELEHLEEESDVLKRQQRKQKIKAIHRAMRHG